MNLMTINIFSCLFLFPAMALDMRMSTTGNDVIANLTSGFNQSVSGPETSSPSAISVCIVSSFMSSLVAHGSVLAMLSVGVDQYLAILDPLEYPFKATRVVSWQMISLVWALGFASSLGTAFQMVTAARHSPWSSCRRANWLFVKWSQNELSPWHRNRTWLSLTSFSLYSFPVFALAFMYFRIFWAARKNSRDIRRNSFHLTLPIELEYFGGRPRSKDNNNLLNQRDEESKSEPSDSAAPCSVKENYSAPSLSAKLDEENSSNNVVKVSNKIDQMLTNDDNSKILSSVDLNTESKNCEDNVRRPPKLSALRASSNGTFCKPLVMTSFDVGTIDDKVAINGSPILHSGGSATGLQRRIGSRLLVTPKRKCSFSSFSECRLVADGGKTRTFLFSMETPSMSPPISPAVKDESEIMQPPRDTMRSNSCSVGERRRQFSLSGASEFNSTIADSCDQQTSLYLQPQDPSPESNSGSETPEGSYMSDGGAKIQKNSNGEKQIRRFSLDPVDPNAFATSPTSVKLDRKSGSIISMTSQAARRLSCTVSRRASSVYQFFQYREELRTAKITALVLVIAFVCWSPFFFLLICIALQNTDQHQYFNVSDNLTMMTEADNLEASSSAIFWLHFTSCLMGLTFAAASPYVYVFRSQKVQKCLKKLICDLVCCCSGDSAPEMTSKLASRAGSISCVQANCNIPSLNVIPPTTKNPTPTLKNKVLSTINSQQSTVDNENNASHQVESHAQIFQIEPFHSDRRSLSCPSLDMEPIEDSSTINHKSDFQKIDPKSETVEKSPTNTPIALHPNEISKPHNCSDFISNRTKRLFSPDLLIIRGKKCDCRTWHRNQILPCTRSNLEIDDDIMEEEEEMLMNERNLEHRRLSTSLPFGLDLLERPPLETTV